mgnify:CR=1 FL=1
MALAEYRNYIGGRFVGSTRQFDDVDPATGKVTGVRPRSRRFARRRCGRCRAHGVARAVGRSDGRAARRRSRQGSLLGIERRAEDFLAAEVGDTGKPAQLARSLDVPRGIANFRTFANVIRAAGGEFYESAAPDGGALNYTIRRPLGVVGVISPWNLPLLLFTWKVAPALACGNTIVAKPSEETPATATLLAEVMHEAGLPAGVFNLVHGFGPELGRRSRRPLARNRRPHFHR